MSSSALRKTPRCQEPGPLVRNGECSWTLELTSDWQDGCRRIWGELLVQVWATFSISSWKSTNHFDFLNRYSHLLLSHPWILMTHQVHLWIPSIFIVVQGPSKKKAYWDSGRISGSYSPQVESLNQANLTSALKCFHLMILGPSRLPRTAFLHKSLFTKYLMAAWSTRLD